MKVFLRTLLSLIAWGFLYHEGCNKMQAFYHLQPPRHTHCSYQAQLPDEQYSQDRAALQRLAA